MTKRDHERLSHVRPDLAKAVARILNALEELGFPMGVTDGLRTTAQQQALYAKGRPIPGRVVTNADGVIKKSPHQEGRAVDCAFIVDGKCSWDARLPWELYGTCAEAVGLRCGGLWKSPVDRPHVELQSRLFGVGITFKVSPVSELYLEAVYHWIDSERSAEIVPVTIGVRW